MRAVKKYLQFGLLSVAALLVVLTSAVAAPVTFVANTAGTFAAGSSVGSSIGGGGTSITNNGATVTFATATPAINATLVPPGEPGLNSTIVQLGTLTTTGAAITSANMNGATFALQVNFTVPGDTGGAQTFNSTLTGTIVQNASDARINWSTTSLTFTSPTAGVFRLDIEPDSLTRSTPINNPGDQAPQIRARLTFVGAAVPEPATLLLLGTGLFGLAGAVRRKRKED